MARFSAVSARLDIQLLTSQQRSREVRNDSPTPCLAQEGGVLQNLCVMLVLVGKEALYAVSSAQSLQAFYKEDVASAKQVQTELENFQDVSVRNKFLLMLYLCLVKLVNKIKW